MPILKSFRTCASDFALEKMLGARGRYLWETLDIIQRRLLGLDRFHALAKPLLRPVAGKDTPSHGMQVEILASPPVRGNDGREYVIGAIRP
jgi:hypothetical protein